MNQIKWNETLPPDSHKFEPTDVYTGKFTKAIKAYVWLDLPFFSIACSFLSRSTMLPDLNFLPPDQDVLPPGPPGDGHGGAEDVVPPGPPGVGQDEDVQNLQRNRVHAEFPLDLNTEQVDEHSTLQQLSAFYSTDSGM